MWKILNLLRIALFGGAVANFLLNGSVGLSVVLTAFGLASFLIRQCRAYRPGGLVSHDYGGRQDTIGGLLGTRIDTNMYRCTRIATIYVRAGGPFEGGCFCKEHAQEEMQYRE